MNRNTTYAMFGVTFALVAGLLGTNILGTQSSGLVAQDDKSSSDGMYITGHVTTIVKDINGNIKAYRQGDNAVVNNGKNCVSKYLFAAGSTRGAAASAGTSCAGALTAPFTAIAIGNGSSTVTTPPPTDYKLNKEAGGNGLDRQLGTVTWTNATSSASSTTLITATFGPWTGVGSSATTVIQEAGLFNSTTDNATTGGMFAHLNISSPPTLNPGDSVTIKYTVNVG